MNSKRKNPYLEITNVLPTKAIPQRHLLFRERLLAKRGSQKRPQNQHGTSSRIRELFDFSRNNRVQTKAASVKPPSSACPPEQ